jgi:hypothetical protein
MNGNELFALSPGDLATLITRKVPADWRLGEGTPERLKSRSCKCGCPLPVHKSSELYGAACPWHAGEPRILFSKNDLCRCRLSVARLLHQIPLANQLQGVTHSLGKDRFYVGYETYNFGRVGFVLLASAFL